MVVLVCGGREYDDREAVFTALDRVHHKHGITLLVHGACPGKNGKRGADLLAEDWAKSREVDYAGHPARWNVEGKPAGPRRNRRMAAAHPIEAAIAFAGGPGTADMIDVLHGMGVKVWAIP